MKQVIINLVMNSLQAVEDVARRKVTLSVTQEAEVVTLGVEDTGSGIQPEHLKRVFDPFFTTKSFNHGTGLGLSICASIVQRHAGDIQIDSTVGIGTTVRVQIPAATITPLASPGETHASQEAQAHPHFSGVNVLVVDDEEYVACAVQETLRLKMDCSVERVFNGLQAIERLQRKEFHLIVSDVRMPGMDGFDLFDWIAKNRPELKRHFLFITGDAGNAELNEKLTRLGAPVLRKPFSPDVLMAECRALVKRPASTRMIA